MSFPDKVIVELIMLVLMLAAGLIMVMHNNKKLQAREQTLLADRAHLLSNQEKLHTEANQAKQERESLLKSYVRLVEDRRRARQKFDTLETALDVALEQLEAAEQFGIPARTHEERSAETNPRTASLDHLQVIPYKSDYHISAKEKGVDGDGNSRTLQ